MPLAYRIMNKEKRRDDALVRARDNWDFNVIPRIIPDEGIGICLRVKELTVHEYQRFSVS
jgi:hypothetical protein